MGGSERGRACPIRLSISAALTLAAIFTLSVTTSAAASPWPRTPASRQACDHRPSPGLCRVHWWVDRTWRLEEQRNRARSTYGWWSERHPGAAPYVWVRHLWRHRARVVARIPIRPWSPAWLADALCVHSGEGAWNAIDPTGTYFGGMQFDISTWLSNGGGQYASRADYATPTEQLLVSYATWEQRGWSPWPNTAAACGLL